MYDIRIIALDFGRADFGKPNFTTYALGVQSSLSVASAKQAIFCGERMFTTIGALVKMRDLENGYQQIVTA